MAKQLELKRIMVFIAIAYSIAWLVALVVYLTGGYLHGQLIPGTRIPLAIPLLAVFYMGAPAAANLLTRTFTAEGWQHLYLRPKIKQGWPFWLIAWFGPGLLTLAGIAIFFLVFPQYYDPQLQVIQQMLQSASGNASQNIPVFNPWMIVLVQTLQALLIAPVLNSLATLGEEFGWRAYLLPKLMPLGWRKASLLMGLVWGVWHWPLIAMGHNYGVDYGGYPWAGLLMTLWVMFLFGVFLGWVSLRGRSVWPAVIGHGALNGIAGLGLLLVMGKPNPLLGPSPAGLVGSLAFTVVVLWMFFFQNPTLDYGEEHVKEVNPPGETVGIIVEEGDLPGEWTEVALEEGDLNGEAGDDLLEHPEL